MFIKKIEDYDGYDATLIVSDGSFEIMCYAWQYNGKSDIKFILTAFMPQDVMRALKPEFLVQRNEQIGYFGYHCAGLLTDTINNIVSIGDIQIGLGNVIPKDIKKGEFIEFTCMRIDLDEK